MKYLVGIVVGLALLLLLAGLYVFYRVKGYAESLHVDDMAGSASKAPTMPMIDPEAFGTPHKEQ